MDRPANRCALILVGTLAAAWRASVAQALVPVPPALHLAHSGLASTSTTLSTLQIMATRAALTLGADQRPADDLVVLADNMAVLPSLPDAGYQLIYIDPPFNTGKSQARSTLQTVPDRKGDRVGFQGRRYRTRLLAESRFLDVFEDYLAFLEPRLREARRLLSKSGTLYFHIDYREAHYCKLLLDEIFGRECFLNELIWAYDYGARTKRRWPAKHDTILVYVKDPAEYYYDAEAVDREPYMAPGLVTPEKVARGKLPTDVWWHTIVPTNGAEKTGYPTQKPEGIVRRMTQASTRPGDWCLDFFAGSGTLGAVAAKLGRRYLLIDSNPDAVAVMRKRLPSATVNVCESSATPAARVRRWPSARQPDRRPSSNSPSRRGA